MEVVGGVASIAGLAEISLKLYRTASQIARDYLDAPSEFSRLAQQLDILRCELSLLAEIERQTTQDDGLLLLPNESRMLERALTTANELILNSYRELDKLQPQKFGSKARLRWALKDKSRTKELVANLSNVETSITNVLVMLNIRLSSLSWKAAASQGIYQRTDRTNYFPRKETDPANIKQESMTDLSLSRTMLSPLFDRNPQAWNSFYGSWHSSEVSLLSWFGLRLILSSYGNAIHTTVFLSGRLQLWKNPKEKALFFSLGLRIFPLAYMGFSILRGGLTVRSIVPDHSELMSACQRGDVSTVRRLFASRSASPYDVTASNCGPLRFAIESGSLELVKFLCYHGTDVNTTFGQFETSPLGWAFRSRQIEIARFFLTQGANLDYLCYRGWTPAMLLFQQDFSEAPVEFFELLSCHSFTDFDVQDRYGATALHRAALWGTAADVHNLLQLGASPCLTDTDLGWTPIFAAASTNNMATIRRLAESMPADFVNHIDFKGWTILHLGIEVGSLETMTLALELGADPYQSLMADSGGDGILKDTSPLDFARLRGTDTYQHFIRALQVTGYSLSTVEDVDEIGLYWDAPEYSNSRRG